MRYKLLILVSGSVLALGACNRHDEQATNTDIATQDNGAVTNVSAPLALTAQAFANAAAASDKFEIESSKLAAASASSAAVKSFAAQMVSAHQGSTAKLKATAGAQTPAITPDDTLTPEQQATLDNLKSLKGAQFDTAYAAAQVDAHQKALDALNGYASSGDNPALKDFAKGLVPTVTEHLNMAKGLK